MQYAQRAQYSRVAWVLFKIGPRSGVAWRSEQKECKKTSERPATLAPPRLHDNHSGAEKALIWAPRIHGQSAERRQLHRVLKCLIEALQSEYVTASLWFGGWRQHARAAADPPLALFKGCWGVNRIDAPAFAPPPFLLLKHSATGW